MATNPATSVSTTDKLKQMRAKNEYADVIKMEGRRNMGRGFQGSTIGKHVAANHRSLLFIIWPCDVGKGSTTDNQVVEENNLIPRVFSGA